MGNGKKVSGGWFLNLMGPISIEAFYPDGLDPLHTHHPTHLTPVKPSPTSAREQPLTQQEEQQFFLEHSTHNMRGACGDGYGEKSGGSMVKAGGQLRVARQVLAILRTEFSHSGKVWGRGE